MECPINTPLDVVKHHIAHTMLGAQTANDTVRVGHITLHPHQVSALHRVQAAIKMFGGALLCDDVGLGKTYVALAAATHYSAPLIIAPATLRTTWHAAMHDAEIQAQWLSIQRLSTGKTPTHPYDFIIVDEAHHARTPSTKRYSALARLCATTPVLLLSATPIHNTRADLDALVALFLGSHAKTLTPQQFAQLVIRRTRHHVPTLPASPTIGTTRWIPAPHDAAIGQAILQLPPPVPVHHTHTAPALVTLNLLRQWSSSEATLRHALARRIARAHALLHALDAGHLPTVHDVHRWTIGDDAMQLTFPQLMPPAPTETLALADAIRTHTAALRQLHARIPRQAPSDTQRANIIRTIRARHPNERIIAFSQYARTIHHLFQHLRHDPHVAALTADKAQIASGPITRQQILARFAPASTDYAPTRSTDDITLLLTTDLLSEGVNLQAASVLIHLDFPWTPATLHQRIGRLARIGSPHTAIHIYGFKIPPLPEQHVRMMATLRTKARTTRTVLGPSNGLRPTRTNATPHVLETSEIIQRTLATWQIQTSPLPRDIAPATTVCATLRIPRTSRMTSTLILAACAQADCPYIIAGYLNGPLTDDPVTIAQIMKRCDGTQDAHQRDTYTRAIQAIHRWWSHQTARQDAGLSISQPRSSTTHRHILQHIAALASRLPAIHRRQFAASAADIINATNQRHPIHLERDWQHRAQSMIEHVSGNAKSVDHSPFGTFTTPAARSAQQTDVLRPSQTTPIDSTRTAQPSSALHIVALLILNPATDISRSTSSARARIRRAPHIPSHNIPSCIPPHTPSNTARTTHLPSRSMRRLLSGLCQHPHVPSPSSSIWTAP